MAGQEAGVPEAGGQEPGSLPGLPTPLYLASPSRLNSWLDCPKRYRLHYLERPAPRPRPARAHTNLGVSVHGALAAWWDLPAPQRTPAAGAALVASRWIGSGFKDPAHCELWRGRSARAVGGYLASPAARIDACRQPLGIERSVALRTGEMAIQGRIDRLDDRAGRLIVVDYKTGNWVPGPDDARTSLPLALYAAAVWKTFRRPCVDVELHHIPTG